VAFRQPTGKPRRVVGQSDRWDRRDVPATREAKEGGTGGTGRCRDGGNGNVHIINLLQLITFNLSISIGLFLSS
jgi:hypothetical protein